MIEYIKFYNARQWAMGILMSSLFTIFTHEGLERHVSYLAPHYFTNTR